MRFVYARSLVDADAYLPTPHNGQDDRPGGLGRPPRPSLPRDHLRAPPLRHIAAQMDAGAPDALDTIMLELALRKERR